MITMKRLLSCFILLCVSVVHSYAQTAVDTSTCSCIKPLFNYLLKANRLNTSKQDNVTVQTLLNDAANAGFATSGCTLLTVDPNALFYTLTPQYVDMPGVIKAPVNAAYRAVVGNTELIFRSTAGAFEHRLSSFYAKNCSTPGTIDYAATPVPAGCQSYSIEHLSNDLPYWYICYVDCSGLRQRAMFTVSQSSAQVCATSIELVQDIDTLNHIYASSWHNITMSESPACVFDANNYNRATVAELSYQTIADNRLQVTADQFTIKACPNPAASYFSLQVTGNSDAPGELKIIDVYGNVVERKTLSSVNGAIKVGSNYRAGIYVAEISQLNQRATVKLVKIAN
jgi:hypothetical protein